MPSRSYAALCAVVGALLSLLGIALFLTFFRYHAPNGSSPFPTGPGGHYFIAFSGCTTLAWGGCLFAARREPVLARALAVPTVIGFTLMAVYRMLVWLLGDYYSLGNLPRTEAAIFLLIALAFVWLRPRKPEPATPKHVAIPQEPAAPQEAV